MTIFAVTHEHVVYAIAEAATEYLASCKEWPEFNDSEWASEYLEHEDPLDDIEALFDAPWN